MSIPPELCEYLRSGRTAGFPPLRRHPPAIRPVSGVETRFRDYPVNGDAHIDRRLGPTLLRGALVLCRFVVAPLAALHRGAVVAKLTPISAAVAASPTGAGRALRQIWHQRLARELLDFALKTPLRPAAVNVVSCRFPPDRAGGCVIAVCHNPWARLLTAWCLDRGFGIPFPGRPLARESGSPLLAMTASGPLRLVRHLRKGGRVVVVPDYFGGARRCPVRFLGVERAVSMFPARLAACAGVPLHALSPGFSGHRLCLQPGPYFEPDQVAADPVAVTRTLLEYFEDRILRRPEFLARFSKQP